MTSRQNLRRDLHHLNRSIYTRELVHEVSRGGLHYARPKQYTQTKTTDHLATETLMFLGIILIGVIIYSL